MTEAKQLHADPAEALNGLYRRYAVWLNRRLRARCDPDDAADLVQETYLKIAPYAERGIRHPKAFLLQVAMNLLRDDRRRDGLKRRLREQHSPPPSEAAAQLHRIMFAEVVQSMPTLYRDVFVLNRFDGMTYAQIADTLGISVKTVEWRMARALEHCASRLEL